MQWFLWGCVAIGVIQVIESVRFIRNGGQMALNNLWVAAVEAVWLVVCGGLLLVSDSLSNPERWLALAFVVYGVGISLVAKKLGFYDGLQARIEQASKDQPGSFGLPEMRLPPALVLPALLFGSGFAAAALWLLV